MSHNLPDYSPSSLEFISSLKEKVLVLDGAMGTMIQAKGVTPDDFNCLTDNPGVDLTGCNDILCLTRPDLIKEIHREYLEAGADIIETNSFNANAFSLSDFALSDRVEEINLAAAHLARSAADSFNSDNRKGRRYVAGSMGPSGVSLSIPDGRQRASWDSMEEAYYIQAKSLISGGVDILLLETIFDTLNAKAAIHGIHRAMRDSDIRLPLILSATISTSGRILSGQTPAAFLASIAHACPDVVGFNCGFGADGMLAPLEWLAANSPWPVSAYPNAGLPDEMGRYTETPEKMAMGIREMLEKRLVNIVGGCCGTTPAHIRLIAEEAAKGMPHVPAVESENLVLSANEPLIFKPGKFIKVGERCNVAGSRKFLRLINEGNISEALDVAAAQIEKGASVLDINMDDGMLNAPSEMEAFVKSLGSDSRTSSTPLMIDSSDMKVILPALKAAQGRCVVNSISLKNGEEAFIDAAREIRELGAVPVVMAFDEKGQATTFARRTEICGRAYSILTSKVGFQGYEIVFDPNILAVATGLGGDEEYALDFLKTTKWIKDNLPGALVSGGVSNLSFSFRGNDPVRKAIHSRFLELAIENGLDMAIINPATPLTSDYIDKNLLSLIDGVLLNKEPNAADKLIEEAARLKADADEKKRNLKNSPSVASKKPTDSHSSASELLVDRVVAGIDDSVENIIMEAVKERGSALAVVEECLMKGMDKVGSLFGEGRLFLPQVVKSAAVMKKAVVCLTPMIEKENKISGGLSEGKKRPLMVLATVKGDVHDIGKNIVSIVMNCGGFDVIDLGVMVDAETIVEKAMESGADCIGLSGLITPSLHEMEIVATLMEERGLKIPLFVGGATTSDLHTAVKIAPRYSGVVAHTSDAASLPGLATRLCSSSSQEETETLLRERNEKIRSGYELKKKILPLAEARQLAAKTDKRSQTPVAAGSHILEIPVKSLKESINWREFLSEWGMHPSGKEKESEKLVDDAKALLDSLDLSLRAKVVISPARSDDETIEISSDNSDETISIPTLRSQIPGQADGKCRSMADFINPDYDWIGLFAVTTAGSGLPEMIESEKNEYMSLLYQTLSHRLVEAATQFTHEYALRKLWGLDSMIGIRPAVGYASLPDQSLIFVLDKILEYENMGIQPTENGALYPSATTSGLIIPNPDAHYFEVGPIGEDQLTIYAEKRGMTVEKMRKFIRM